MDKPDGAFHVYDRYEESEFSEYDDLWSFYRSSCFHYGAERLGALVIPPVPKTGRRIFQLMKNFGTTEPSYQSESRAHLPGVFKEVTWTPKDT
jgi:hypothetical protein